MDREELFWRLVLQRVNQGPVPPEAVDACWKQSHDLLVAAGDCKRAEHERDKALEAQTKAEGGKPKK